MEGQAGARSEQHREDIARTVAFHTNKQIYLGSHRLASSSPKTWEHFGYCRIVPRGILRSMLRTIPSAWLLISALATATCAPAPAIVTEKDVSVRMRDGAVLRADVWRPSATGRFPVLVYRTPYNKARAVEHYTIFRRAVERSYAVVIQDVRGRYASEGEFTAYWHEGRDGYDTIEWAAAQSWSNGAVGTFGLSYPGAVQWLAAVERPPHLRAMVPAMTFSSPKLFFYAGGVFDLSWIPWIWNHIAPDIRVKKNLPGPRTGTEARAAWPQVRERLYRHLPLSDLPDFREVAPFYYDWLRHPPGDPWWDWAELENKYDRVDAAVLNLSGWYDEAYGPSGASRNFVGLRRQQSQPRTQLIVGAWVHGVDAIAKTCAGERKFGPAARLDYDEIVLRWLDRYVKGVDNGVDKQKPVKIFVMGDNVWREADDWPLPQTNYTPLYLHPPPAGKGAGRLAWEPPAENGGFSSYVSDAANPVVDSFAASYGAHNQREVESRADVLTFDSEPLDKDLEITGPILAELYVSSDAPDSDFWVRLIDVAPDGTAFNLMNPGLDALRASYRHGGPTRELLEPGRIYKLRLPNLLTSNVFKRGHRLRVEILSSFFPHFSRNLHTGELETVSARPGKATNRIYHRRAQASRLILPIIPR